MKHTLAIILALLFAAPVLAKNVDLSTVPDRATVSLTIYNSEDLTLVRETRIVSFKKGNNPLQFSWANTLIDSTSVELRFLKNADKLELLDTTFPNDKPQMLYWNVQSEIDGEVPIEITYFTSGISWAADYTCIADNDEKHMRVDSFVRITNNSGEDYENAKVRLVVGTINLVEQIAQLAQSTPEKLGALSEESKKAAEQVMRQRVAGVPKFDLSSALSSSGGSIFSGGADSEKQIVKEGLSEYFVFTIEGTETIPNGWSKRMRSFEADDCPMKIQYRYRADEYGDQLVRMYILTNDKDSKLGNSPLPNGQVRVFRNNGRDGLSFIASQTVNYIPIGDKIELNLGTDPEVIFELITLKSSRDNIWMQLNGADVFQQVGGRVAIDVNATVAGWDDHDLYTQRIRNYTPRSIEVEVRRSYGGDVRFRSALKPKLYDFQTVEFTATVDAGKRADLLHEVVTKQEHNAKQQNVTLEDADLKPR